MKNALLVEKRDFFAQKIRSLFELPALPSEFSSKLIFRRIKDSLSSPSTNILTEKIVEKNIKKESSFSVKKEKRRHGRDENVFDNRKGKRKSIIRS